MNKLTLGIYRILSVVVMLSMTLSMVGPASALTPQQASQTAPQTKTDATPYDPFLSANPYAALLKDAPLPELSLADVAAMDTASLLAMPSVPSPFGPQDANNPLSLLGKFGQPSLGAANPSQRIMDQAQAQSQKAEAFSWGAWWEGLFAPVKQVAKETADSQSKNISVLKDQTPSFSPGALPQAPLSSSVSSQRVQSLSSSDTQPSANVNAPNAGNAPILLAPPFAAVLNTPAPAIFYENTVSFSYTGGPVILYGVSDPSNLYTDDRVLITITHPNGSIATYDWDYSKAGPGITSTGPIDLTNKFVVGKNDVTIQLWNMLVPSYGSSGYQLGAGSADLTPPQIKIVEVWPDGRGNLTIKAYVVDPESGITSVTISGNGIRNAPMIPLGNDLYSYTFRNIPNGKIIEFTITAINGEGLTATAKGSSRSPKYFDMSAWLAKEKCCGVVIGDPIPLILLNFTYILPVMYFAGPGKSGIVFSLTYNSQDPRAGIYGQGWTGSYQMSLDFRDNDRLKGIDVTYPDGRLVLFENQGNGTYKSVSPGVSDRIEKRGAGYVLITDQAMEYEFTSAGRLIIISDSNKNEIRLSYAGDKLTRLENDGGRAITLTYNGDGKVSALDGPENKHVEFGYTGPTLTSFKDLRGQTWTYVYQSHDNGTLLDVDGNPYQAIDYWMTEIKTPKGFNSVKNVYNEKGEVIEQWVGEREHRQFSRDEAARITTLTDAYSKVTKYSHDDQWRLTRIDYPDKSYEAFDYDDNFNRTYVRDRNGKEWRYTYDDRSNRLTEEGPMGSHREWQYHATFNKPVRAVEKVNGSTSRTWTFDYDDKGNLTSICNPEKCGSMTYNGRGQPLTITDFATNVTTNSYDAEWDLATTANGEGETISFSTDGAGRTVSITSPLGKAFTFTFDPGDKLTAVNGPMGYHTATSYDPNGNLSTQTDANGGKTVYSFDTSEKLTGIKNQNNVSIATYEYGAMNEVTAFADGEGRRWTYDNDADQRMTGMHGPLGVNILFQRDAVGNIIESTDAEGRVTRMTYDDLYRVIKTVENAQGGNAADANITTSFSYTLVGDLLNTTDPENNQTVFEYDLLSRMTLMRDAEGQETGFAYDPMGNINLLTNPRKQTTGYTYDRANRLKTVTNPLKFVFTYAYDKDGHLSDLTDPLKVITHSEYDDLGRLAKQVQNYKPGVTPDSQTNVTIKYEYDKAGNLKVLTDPRGKQATYFYDPAFRLTDTVDLAGGHTHYEYDKVDNLLSVMDGNSHLTKYDVDALDRVIQVTNPQGHAVKFTYNKTGALTHLVDANGNPTKFTLDKLDRVVTMQDALGGLWDYNYDKVGNILVETDANRHATRLTYDKVYRLLSSTDAEDNVTRFAWDANGNLTKLTDGNKNPTGFTYDAADQLIASANAENETTRYEYNALGYQSKLIEADNTVTLYGYDPIYRLNAVTENYKNGGASNNDTNVVTRYKYDASSNMEQFINAKGAVTKFEHDGMGRVTKETNPLGSVWKYGYDKVGNLVSRVDAIGKLTSYKYFEDDQLQQISYFDGTTVKFGYDPNNNLLTMQDKLGVSSWKYDALNRVTLMTDALKRSLGFSYDAVGNRAGMTYPDKNPVTYTYYDNNWLKSMTSPAGASAYTRDGVGNITHIQNPNSTETDIAYDKVNRTTKLVNRQLTGATKINSSFEYVYNEVGHVTNVTATYASREETWTNGRRVGWQKNVQVKDTYGYDGLHRLTSAARSGKQSGQPGQGEKLVGWNMTYAYDAVGNRAKWQTDDNPFTANPKDGLTATYTYNAANQLVKTSVNAKKHSDNVTVAYTYDKNGNRIDQLTTPLNGLKTGTSYTYDPENRLKIAQDYKINGAAKRINGAATALAYDGMGRRLLQIYDPKLATTGGAKRVEYTFDGLDPVVETSMWNKQYDNYYRGAMGRISVRQHFPAGTDGQLYWYDYNSKGDVTDLTKQSGQSVHAYQYDPYGGVIPDNGSFTDPHNHYTLTGKEYDENTGLVYFGARHYDPQTAQWMTQDGYRGQNISPITLNRMLYVKSNPVNNADLYGFCTNGECVQDYKNYAALGDYNRLDSIIEEKVEYWNKKFSTTDNPLGIKRPDDVPELDPNLVKAMLMKESRIGYDPNAYNKGGIMQITEKDAISKLKEKDYDVSTYLSNDSYNIEAGVLWLYRKQLVEYPYVKENYDDYGKDVSWYDGQNVWKRGVRGYNGWGSTGKDYTNDVFNLYEKGIYLGKSYWTDQTNFFECRSSKYQDAMKQLEKLKKLLEDTRAFRNEVKSQTEGWSWLVNKVAGALGAYEDILKEIDDPENGTIKIYQDLINRQQKIVDAF